MVRRMCNKRKTKAKNDKRTASLEEHVSFYLGNQTDLVTSPTRFQSYI